MYSRETLNLSRMRDCLPPIPVPGEQIPENVSAAQIVLETSEAHIQNSVGNGLESNSYSINEFARLCIIMRDDEDAKVAFGGIGQELSRNQIDAGFTTESYWGIIEERFNDSNVKLHLSMVGNLEDVDSTLPPPVYRNAVFLEDKFFDARSSFTTCLKNWSQSGQNDNKDFKAFAGSRDGLLKAQGKRNTVLFVCARIGTEHEDTRFSILCTRMIPFNRGCDEGGDASEGPGSQRQSGSSKRKQSNDESAFERSFMEYSKISIRYKREKSRERRERIGKKRQREDKNHRNEDFRDKSLLLQQMGAFHDRLVASGLDPGPTYQDCAKKFIEEVKCLLNTSRAPGQVQEHGSGNSVVEGGAAGNQVSQIEDEIQPNL